MKCVFFGSFRHYSAIVLQSLLDDVDITFSAVITTPPQLESRKKILTPTPVEVLAQKHDLPVLHPASLSSLHDLNQLITKQKITPQDGTKKPVDFFVVAGYGQILPDSWLNFPEFGSLNLHFSLLPDLRGANPAEWALMLGLKKTGVTLIEMSPRLDAGDIIAKKDLPISPTDTRITLYDKLYKLGASQLPSWLKRHFMWRQKSQFYCQQSLAPFPQPAKSPTPYAALLRRADGFIAWDTLNNAILGKALTLNDFPNVHHQKALSYLKATGKLETPHSYLDFLHRLVKAFDGFPHLWTTVPTAKGDKRLLILSTTIVNQKLVLEEVQLEGLKPSRFNQIKNVII